MERGPTRASARLERDLSRGHAAAAKGPWRREVAALVELVLEQVAAAEESALERVADTHGIFAAVIWARTPSRRGRWWCSRSRQEWRARRSVKHLWRTRSLASLILSLELQNRPHFGEGWVGF